MLCNLDFGTVTATGFSDPINLRKAGVSCDNAQVFLTGTWVGTTIVQVSADGTNYFTAKDQDDNAVTTTANAVFTLRGNAKYIRLGFTRTSGSVSGRLVTTEV